MMNREAARKREQRVFRISRDHLPLGCPLPEEEVWNKHPRVFLPMDANGEAVCPYCGTRYLLED